MNYQYLMKTIIFNNFTQNQLQEALLQLCARTACFSKEEIIFQEGSFVDEIGIILEGNVRIERIDYQGNRNILAHIGKGHTFAETYALLTKEALLVDVIAGSDCKILFLNLKKVDTPTIQSYRWYPLFLMNLLTISNRKNLELSMRSFHTSPKHIRGRVLSYLLAQSQLKHSTEFDIPFDRQQFADYLNLDRSALSNELAKMQKDELIIFHKNHFKLLKTRFATFPM